MVDTMNRRNFFRRAAAGLLAGVAMVYSPKVLERVEPEEATSYSVTIMTRVCKVEGPEHYACEVFVNGERVGCIRPERLIPDDCPPELRPFVLADVRRQLGEAWAEQQAVAP